MDDRVRDYLSEIGRKGGRKSRRSLSSNGAKQMVAKREARRAALKSLPSYEDLVKRIGRRRVVVVAAIDDVDQTLLDSFLQLTIEQRIASSSLTAASFGRFEK